MTKGKTTYCSLYVCVFRYFGGDFIFFLFFFQKYLKMNDGGKICTCLEIFCLEISSNQAEHPRKCKAMLQQIP